MRNVLLCAFCVSCLVALAAAIAPPTHAIFNVIQTTKDEGVDRAISGSNVVSQRCDGATDDPCNSGNWEIYLIP
jgi:hypothetical protein